MIKAIGAILLIGLLVAGCGGLLATKAHITGPDKKVYKYEGPKNIDMSMETDGVKIKYSGKTPPWWHGLLPILIGKTPNVTVVK